MHKFPFVIGQAHWLSTTLSAGQILELLMEAAATMRQGFVVWEVVHCQDTPNKPHALRIIRLALKAIQLTAPNWWASTAALKAPCTSYMSIPVSCSASPLVCALSWDLMPAPAWYHFVLLGQGQRTGWDVPTHRCTLSLWVMSPDDTAAA